MPRKPRLPLSASMEATPPVGAEEPTSAAPGAALLVVDLQTTLLHAFPPAVATALRARAALALAASRTLHLPIFFTEQVPAKLGHTDPALRTLVPRAPAFPKNTFSALAAEELLAKLRALKIEHLLLIGIETPICIYQTALHALAEGFQVTVLSDAVGARRADDHATCLAALRHAGIHVLPVETVFYSLLHDAGHPAFSAFNVLVKMHV